MKEIDWHRELLREAEAGTWRRSQDFVDTVSPDEYSKRFTLDQHLKTWHWSLIVIFWATVICTLGLVFNALAVVFKLVSG